MDQKISEQGKAKDKLIEKLQTMLRDSVDEVTHKVSMRVVSSIYTEGVF